MKRFRRWLFCLPLLLPAYALAATECSESITGSSALARQYTDKNGNDEASFTIAGYGNEGSLFEDYTFVTPTQLAAKFAANPAFKAAKQVVLIWPYSGADGKPYALALEKIIEKPVIGFKGAVWWYPDGTALSGGDSLQPPDDKTVGECISKEGKYLQADECRKILPTLKKENAVFANIPFLLDCEHVNHLTEAAAQHNATANLRLYFYHAYVNLMPEKARNELDNAAAFGDSLANYIKAREKLEQSTPDMALYKQFLERSARKGYEPAKKELKRFEATQ